MGYKTNNITPPALSMNYLIRLQSIFKNKNWPIDGIFDENVFDNFCSLLSRLDPEQSELILSLTEDFLWVQESEYIKLFSNAFDIFINHHDFSIGNSICICAALAEEDFGKVKSSTSLLYGIKARKSSIRAKYSGFNITYCDSPEFIDFSNTIGVTYCLIDDFIGTGETMNGVVNYAINKGIQKNQIAIVSLVGMDFGLQELNSKGYNTYTSIIQSKALSSRNNENEIRIMKELESKIKVSLKYKFGYNGSEALVKMIRTPNNTFPIYWLRNKKNKHAPFPRG